MSYEEEMKSKSATKSFEDDRVRIPVLKYFWQASSISGRKNGAMHTYLSQIDVFSHFSDFELHKLSQFIHKRTFIAQERIFSEGASGYGFYLIYKGDVEVLGATVDDRGENVSQLITVLGEGDYFGELALLESKNIRNATIVAKSNTVLFAIFRPDLDELTKLYPVIATKLIQSVSLIVARRFNSMAHELRSLKQKIKYYEEVGQVREKR